MASTDELIDTSPADILGVSMQWLDDGIRLTGTLAADPREADGMTFSYWIGFQDGGRSAGGNPPTWTWQGSTTYDEIRTMYWDGPFSYPVQWNDTTFSFLVPWTDFDAEYGDGWDFAIGSPRLSSSGPNVGPHPLNNPSQDWAEFDRELVPLQCAPTLQPVETEPVAESSEPVNVTPEPVMASAPEDKESPVPWWLALMAFVIARRR